ncbi:hypothetical protein CERZMDRAFT_114075 [Cercospora zeae-maydis SCOH1-5]|uniref:AB hydrolase-1 domain-containing protein n=1 Tax=Cercospora zeae-maydis SCOH1-5 TaxID=717836 RepID=A0A6A6F7L5_9PEZI|nr:hypothetical protein CERZMDRAFT_114075 [Cercospora zeae-maydis SCOH1-5]
MTLDKAAAGLAHNDPRSSSQESLGPQQNDTQRPRRRLLLIYIHGFMGAETSFRSFPAHVHNLLTVLLSETHVIHTKVYPRYASRGKIIRARDDFGRWIEPHQDASTDVVLLGHSMGGLLSAEVVLAPGTPPRPLRHRVLGTINFDVPFLGMHPGVVKSGLASIFAPADKPHDQQNSATMPEPSSPGASTPIQAASRADTLWSPEQQDPNYNPSFANDVILPVRKGWRNAWHFISKHSDDLTTATKKLVSSHLEFGGAMANYHELRSRYARVRALEEYDVKIRQSVVGPGYPPRVRFVNYYTASTGRPKKPESPHRHASRTTSRPVSQCARVYEVTRAASSVNPSSVQLGAQLESFHCTEAAVKADRDSHGHAASGDESARVPAIESRDAYQERSQPRQKPAQKSETDMTHDERESSRLQREQQRMEYESRRLRGEPETSSERTSSTTHLPIVPMTPPINFEPSQGSSLLTETSSGFDRSSLAPTDSRTSTDSGLESQKPKKDRMFCTLPPEDSSGERDPCWVRVLMENVDEVGAHCGLFFVDERYERLVGDVAARVETWVKADCGSTTGWPRYGEFRSQ